MENIVAFPDWEAIQNEAADWLVRLDSERELTEAELIELQAWIHRSPAHGEELQRLAEFWGDQSLVALPIPLSRLLDVAAEPEPKEAAGAAWWANWPGRSVAAFAVLAVCLSVFSVNGLLPTWMQWGADAQTLYATAIGQQQTLDLPDGSRLYLNTNSQVRVDYQPGWRNIHLLQGEAHFDVAKHTARPFRVYAGRGRVEAVGTAFTVFFSEAEDIDVVVEEGTVAVALLDTPKEGEALTLNSAATQGAAPVASNFDDHSEYYLAIPVDQLGLLAEGQAVTLRADALADAEGEGQLEAVRAVAKDEMARRGAWRSGLLVFSGDTLESVVREVSRYTALSIEIVDPELNEVRIGGRFSVDNLQEFFDALEANFGLRIDRLGLKRVQISMAQKKSS